MNPPGHHISRPIYEALPYIYILCGLVALAASYLHPSKLMSLLLGLPGLVGVLGGVVVVLRRRDYRQMKANNYLNTDLSAPSKRDE
jgi:Flp pilus assembly protein TadB